MVFIAMGIINPTMTGFSRWIHIQQDSKWTSQVMLSGWVPSLSVGPGFLSTSPAIRRRDSTTAHTRSSKHTPLPTPAIPQASALVTDPPSNLGQRTLPYPPQAFRFGRPPHLRNAYSSISDRETTAMHPWSTRGVLFTTSPTPHLAALHRTGSGRQAYRHW